MILAEVTSIQSGDLPFYEFKNHLRLGSGFAEDNLQDPLIEAYLRAAISAIESRLGLALLTRQFKWHLYRWSDPQRQGLPMRPVSQVLAVAICDRDGQCSQVDADRYRLIEDAHGAALLGQGALPSLPSECSLEIDFMAGYGVTWSDIPPDLAQAVLLLAAHFYENRSASQSDSGFPMPVLSLIEGFRAIRLGGAA